MWVEALSAHRPWDLLTHAGERPIVGGLSESDLLGRARAPLAITLVVARLVPGLGSRVAGHAFWLGGGATWR